MTSFERVRTKVSHASIKYGVLAMSCMGLVLTRDVEGARNALPEPLDVMDHAGNVDISAHLGYFTGLATGVLMAKRAEKFEEPPSTASLRTKMALGGFVMGMVINGLVETKFGMKIVPWENTRDPIDLAYGVVAATTAASLVPNIEQVTQAEYTRSG